MQGTLYMDFGSPYSYLAWARVRNRLGEGRGRIRLKPVSAGHLFKMEGTKPNMSFEKLGPYHLADVARWARALAIPYHQPHVYPQNTLAAMRAYYALLGRQPATAAHWLERVLAAHWAKDMDLSDPSTLSAIADGLGIENFAELVGDPAAKQRLIDATKEAYDRGAPGVPFVVLDTRSNPDDEPIVETYWGNDRIDWVIARMSGETAPPWLLREASHRRASTTPAPPGTV